MKYFLTASKKQLKYDFSREELAWIDLVSARIHRAELRAIKLPYCKNPKHLSPTEVLSYYYEMQSRLDRIHSRANSLGWMRIETYYIGAAGRVLAKNIDNEILNALRDKEKCATS